MKLEINTVRDFRDFLTKLIRKSKCGDEQIKFLLNEEYSVKWLKLDLTSRGGLIKETTIEFKIK
jgi:hypothetical protein